MENGGSSSYIFAIGISHAASAKADPVSEPYVHGGPRLISKESLESQRGGTSHNDVIWMVLS